MANYTNWQLFTYGLQVLGALLLVVAAIAFGKVLTLDTMLISLYLMISSLVSRVEACSLENGLLPRKYVLSALRSDHDQSV